MFTCYIEQKRILIHMPKKYFTLPKSTAIFLMELEPGGRWLKKIAMQTSINPD